MSPPLTLTHTLWALTAMVWALSFALAIITRNPHMLIAVFAVLAIGAFAATPQPKEQTP